MVWDYCFHHRSSDWLSDSLCQFPFLLSFDWLIDWFIRSILTAWYIYLVSWLIDWRGIVVAFDWSSVWLIDRSIAWLIHDALVLLYKWCHLAIKWVSHSAFKLFRFHVIFLLLFFIGDSARNQRENGAGQRWRRTNGNAAATDQATGASWPEQPVVRCISRTRPSRSHTQCLSSQTGHFRPGTGIFAVLGRICGVDVSLSLPASSSCRRQGRSRPREQHLWCGQSYRGLLCAATAKTDREQFPHDGG